MNFYPEKKLGFGMMRLPTREAGNAAAVDLKELDAMVDTFLENGFTYFDTAWMYNAFESENAAGKSLVGRHARESFTLATKLHAGFLRTKEDRDRIFGEQLRKTGAGYFDYYLIHGIEEGMLPVYENLDCFRWLLDKKAGGFVRHAGFSFHDKPELLERILTDHPEMEFVQLQINYLDWESEWIQSRACYEVCRKYGKPVIVMEPVKGGTLAHVPAEGEKLLRALDPSLSVPSFAIRFAASLPGVMTVLSGMSNMEQMRDNISYMKDFQPLSEEEKETLFRVAEIINEEITVPCTGCSYCTEGCPMGIPIPKFFSLYNEDMREDLSQKGWTVNYTNYELLAEKTAKASDCLACGQCEGVCPQHLSIIDFLKSVAEHYES
ncbi:MAG: aldo/keto reductase [Clostridia bacterium]|nr:aldo/keto reductase [Clostridia bacterium]